jgi:glycosyltransferase involved in cell wall biosynthesis
MSSREGWANVILESLACGTPVIASNVGGALEIIGHTDAGMVLSERTPEALARAIGAIRNAMPDRLATRRYALAFGWQPVAKAYARLLADAATTKSPMQDVARKYSVLAGSDPG